MNSKSHCIKIFFLFCLMVSASLVQAKDILSLTGLKQIKAIEPTLSQLTETALEQAELSSASTKSWHKKLKASALMPKFYVGYDHQIKNAESLSITDNISTASGVITIGPEDNNIDVDQDVGHVLRLRASWDLSDLVFHSQTLSLAKYKADALKFKRDLSDEVYAIYEKRYFVLNEYLKNRKSNSDKAKMLALKVELLTDRLDELTKGRFHSDFWRAYHD